MSLLPPQSATDISGRAPERRSHHRVLVGAPAWLVIPGDRELEKRIDAECVNLSMGGASVFTEARVELGAKVRFELSTGRYRGSVTIQCEVVRCGQADVGLRFLALDRRSLEAIVRLI